MPIVAVIMLSILSVNFLWDIYKMLERDKDGVLIMPDELEMYTITYILRDKYLVPFLAIVLALVTLTVLDDTYVLHW